jgi:predicted short-subunit dehydrogenase-like oxidoreductase (DUF2520 family)
MKPVIGVIGAGRVGQTLARGLHRAGYPIAAVCSRSPEPAVRLAAVVGAAVVSVPQDVPTQCDLTLLTVPDDALSGLAGTLAQVDWTGRAAVHTSGAHSREVLAPLAARGALTGSLHPAYPFAAVETALRDLPGTTFALEAEDQRLVDWLGDIVSALKGTILRIPPGAKPLYHAALVIASNYTVTLYAAAERLLLSLGADRAAVDGALNALVGATVLNLREQGIPDALTGPLARGDAGTVSAHAVALAGQDRLLAQVYLDLARLTLPLLAARGTPLEAIRRLLEQDDGHATDHT